MGLKRLPGKLRTILGFYIFIARLLAYRMIGIKGFIDTLLPYSYRLLCPWFINNYINTEQKTSSGTIPFFFPDITNTVQYPRA